MFRSTWILFCLAAMLTGCGQSGEQPKASVPQIEENSAWEVPEESAETTPADAPVMKLTIEEINDDVRNGRRKEFGDKTYGKIIESTGVIDKFGQDLNLQRIQLILAPPDDPALSKLENLQRLQLLNIEMSSPAEAWEKASPGDTVTVQMVWSDFDGLHEGRIVSGGTVPGKATAAEIAADVAADRAAAKEKYDGKYFIVSGALAAESPGLIDNYKAFEEKQVKGVLVGDDKTSIALDLANMHMLVMKDVPAGKEILVIGKVRILDDEKTDEKHPYSVGLLNASRLDDD